MTRSVVGNDVVDLSDPFIAEHHRHERFVARVCAAEERARVATQFDLWSLFAAKEAAYKALVKLGFAPGFGHREIVVAPDARTVRWRGQDLRLSISMDERHVHAVAWAGAPGRPMAQVARTRGDEKGTARSLVCRMLAAAIGCDPRELEVVRDPIPGAWDGFGPPRVTRHGACVDADVSLSHDGAFAAAAVVAPAKSARSENLRALASADRR